MSAGSLGKTATAPLSRMTVLYQVFPELSHYSLWEACSRVMEEEGLYSFWKGNLTSVVHRFPYSAINFTVYENLRYKFCDKTQYGWDETMFVRLFCGASSGAAAVVSCYPLDIVRTRFAATLSVDGTARRSIPGLIGKIIQEEGLIHGLYRGLGMSVVVAVPNIAISFAVYGTSKQYFMNMSSKSKRLFCHPETGKFTFFGGVISGSLSAVAASLLMFPADTSR